MGFGTVDAHMIYTDCVNKLNVLAENLQPVNPQSLWIYAVHNINFTYVRFDSVHSLDREVHNLATDFSTGSEKSFDKSKSCTVCSEVGHNFFSFPQLKNNDKVKQVYILLQISLSWFFKLVTSVTKFNDTNNLSLLTTMTLNSLEQILSLAYPQTSVTPHIPTAPCALPPSITPNTNNLLVSTLHSM